MNKATVASIVFAGTSVFSSACIARVPSVEETPAPAKAAQVALAVPAGVASGLTPNETLIHLHRAVTGIHFLPPAFSETTVRCCEPSRASR